MAQRKAELRFIMLGKTGEGKSATGNLILGRDVFLSRASFDSVTQAIAFRSNFLHMHNRNVTVVDTPGLFDNRGAMLNVMLEVQRSLDVVMPGPHAFLIVMQFSRFTAEAEHTLDILKMTFGEELFDYTIVIFTHVQNAKDLAESLGNNVRMQGFIGACSGRHIAVDNYYRNRTMNKNAIFKLMQLTDTISDNGKKHYARNVSIYKDVLEAHIADWSDRHLTSEQIRTILKEQEKKRQNEMFKTIGVAACKVGAGMAIGAGAGIVATVGEAVVGGALTVSLGEAVVSGVLTAKTAVAAVAGGTLGAISSFSP